MNKLSGWRGWMSVAGLVLLLACGAAVWQAQGSALSVRTMSGVDTGAQQDDTADGTVNSMAVPVRVFEVRAAGQTPPLDLTGSVRARYQTELAFRVSGKIHKRHVEVGQVVQKGQLLFELDDADYRLQLQTAQANLQVAQASVRQSVAEEKRLAELRRTNAVSASEYERGLSDRDIAQGRLESAQRQLELAHNQLDYCRLHSDHEGIITGLQVEAGQVVSQATPLGTLAQIGQWEAVVDIPENHWPGEPDLTTTARFWSLPDVQCSARLREISPSADPITRTYRARFSLLNPPPSIKLGMTVSLSLASIDRNLTFPIPSTAIIQSDGAAAVWRVEGDGRIAAVPVHIERFGSDAVQVSSGLNEGDKIVSAGVQKLDASMHVRTWENEQ